MRHIRYESRRRAQANHRKGVVTDKTDTKSGGSNYPRDESIGQPACWVDGIRRINVFRFFLNLGKVDGSVWVPEDNAWFAMSREKIAPGDKVVVTPDLDRPDKLELFTSVSQIFYQIAFGAAAVGSL